MNSFKLGCNFSKKLPDLIKQLNTEYPNKIIELYGSRGESHLLAARPEFRLHHIDKASFERYVDELYKIGIAFNYTLNASYIGGKEEILSKEDKIREYISFLINSGVQTITVTLPYMAELIRSVSKGVGIEVSTIAHIDSVTQVKIWKEKYNISKVCVSLNKNRDISFLSQMSDYCHSRGIIATLLANEFCGNGCLSDGVNSTTGCIYRDHCYQLHSIGYGKDIVLGKNYPMGDCTQSRNSAVSWLKLNYIRPEDLCLYNRIGLSHFKITGRTGSTSYIEKIARAYLAESYRGNLLDLWKHLETIQARDEADFLPAQYIENKKLDGFLNFWFENRGHVCANEVCGETCRYCDSFYEKALKEPLL